MQDVLHILLAADFRTAQASAEIDWGWRREPPRQGRWLNEENEPVIFVSDMRYAYGLSDKAILYLGYGFQQRHENTEIINYWMARRRKVLEGPQRPLQPGTKPVFEEWKP